jgi:hypothetical protein
MNVRAKAAQGGLGLIAALVPWIVFWVLVGNVDVRLACLVPLVIVALQAVRTVLAGVKPKVLEIGTLVVFALLTVIAFIGDDAFLDRWVQPLSNGALFLVALCSVLVGKPFALEYAREEVPREVQGSPLFLRTTLLITWVWIGTFAIMTLSSLVPPVVDGATSMHNETDAISVIFYWVVPFVALAGAVLFTKWYPERVHEEAASQAAR